MLQKLRQILATWWRLNEIPLPGDADWTEFDARNLGAFFATETGRKYLRKWEHHCARYAQNAVFKAAEADPRYACGVAAGMQSMFAWSKEISGYRSPQVAESNQPVGAAALIEELAP